MSSELEWVDLQKKIKQIFENAQVKLFKDALEKDKNGWNWILSFHELRTDTSLIVHTKFIFKLTEDKKSLRKKEFLYLKDLNCHYKLVRFDNFEALEEMIHQIFNQDLFGGNMLAISRMMISPAMTINQYFYENNIQGYSVYDFNYAPKVAITPCQDFSMEFEFNVNNNYDVVLTIRKISEEEKEKFELQFQYLDETETKYIETLKELPPIIGQFIEKYLYKN